MYIPAGFDVNTIRTSRGTMAYYSATSLPWLSDEPPLPGLGNDLPTLLFLHGFGGGSSAYEWSQVYPVFAPRFRVLAADLLGWGRSDHLQRFYAIEDYLISITEFIENVCRSESVIVVASSLTAAMVVRLAAVRPNLFRSLILVAPSGLSDFGRDYRRSFIAQLASSPLGPWVYWLGVASRSGIKGFLKKRQFADPKRITPEIIDAYAASANQRHAMYAALSFLRGDLCFDIAAYFKDLKVPTAIIWGEKAQFTSVEIGQLLQFNYPRVVRRFKVLPDIGLTPQLECPAVTAGLIQQYLLDL